MKKLLLLIAGTLLFAACSSSKVSVSNEFWGKQNLKIGIAASSLPEPNAFKGGSQGLLDMAINNAMSNSLEDFLLTVDVSRFYEVKNIFKEQFAKKGFNNITIIDEKVNLDSLPFYKGKKGRKLSNRDLSQVKEKYGLDLLMVFDIKRYGTLRSYYGFIPLESPKALFQVNGMLINLENNEYEWFIKMSDDESVVTVLGEWDQEPDYPNLTDAIHDAVNRAQKFLEQDFFQASK